MGTPTRVSTGSDLNSVVGIVGLVLAVVVMLVQPKLPYHAADPFEVGLLLATTTAVSWLVVRAVAWRRHGGRRGLLGATIATGVLVLASVFVLQPETSAYGRAQCTFGPYGIGLGPVWIKVQPDHEQITRPHAIGVHWGAHHAEIVERLDRDTYFTFAKRDLRSPGLDVVVAPPAMVTCGQGVPPDDAHQVALTPDLWRRG